MIIVCAWCKKALGRKEPLDNEDTTHGICVECSYEVTKEVKVEQNNQSNQ
jgi:cobalamin biosynthesis protein CbiD